MNWTNLWQVMTPTTALGEGQRWVKWRVATQYRHEAVRIVEQMALQMSVEFHGDIEVQLIGRCLVEGVAGGD